MKNILAISALSLGAINVLGEPVNAGQLGGVALVQNVGGQTVNIGPFPSNGVPVSPQATVSVFSFGNNTIIAISEPPPNPMDFPRITTGNRTYQIPNPDDIRNTQQFQRNGEDFVTIEYNDGSTVTVPGNFLAPGEVDPLAMVMPENGVLMAEELVEATPEEANEFLTDLLELDFIEDIFNQPVTIDNVDFDFSGDDNFIFGSGLFTIDYDDGEEDTFLTSAPTVDESSSLLGLLALGGLGISSSIKRFKKL